MSFYRNLNDRERIALNDIEYAFKLGDKQRSYLEWVMRKGPSFGIWGSESEDRRLHDSLERKHLLVAGQRRLLTDLVTKVIAGDITAADGWEQHLDRVRVERIAALNAEAAEHEKTAAALLGVAKELRDRAAKLEGDK